MPAPVASMTAWTGPCVDEEVDGRDRPDHEGVHQVAFFLRAAAAFRAEAERSAFGRAAEAAPPSRAEA